MSAPRLAIRYVLAVVIGIVLLVVVFRWVLIDSYQSVDLPTTPLELRTAIVLALYALVAGLLAYVSRDATWEWGLRVSLPTLVVMGIAALLEGLTSRDAIRDETLMLGLLVAACLGSWLGARMARSRSPVPPT